jgi:hypothetical protein
MTLLREPLIVWVVLSLVSLFVIWVCILDLVSWSGKNRRASGPSP